jgi:hypothetical protein
LFAASPSAVGVANEVIFALFTLIEPVPFGLIEISAFVPVELITGKLP